MSAKKLDSYISMHVRWIINKRCIHTFLKKKQEMHTHIFFGGVRWKKEDESGVYLGRSDFRGIEDEGRRKKSLSRLETFLNPFCSWEQRRAKGLGDEDEK
jgi:hypothetical protein